MDNKLSKAYEILALSSQRTTEAIKLMVSAVENQDQEFKKKQKKIKKEISNGARFTEHQISL